MQSFKNVGARHDYIQLLVSIVQHIHISFDTTNPLGVWPPDSYNCSFTTPDAPFLLYLATCIVDLLNLLIENIFDRTKLQRVIFNINLKLAWLTETTP